MLRNLYGFFMGTTMDIYRGLRKPLPLKVVMLDDTTFFLEGGYINSLLCGPSENSILLNPNSGRPGNDIANYFVSKIGKAPVNLVLQGPFPENIKNWDSRINPKQIYMTSFEEKRVSKTSAVQFLKLNSGEEISIGDWTLRVEQGGYLFENLVVFNRVKKVAALGLLVVNRIHPILTERESKDVSNWIEKLIDLEKEFFDFEILPGQGPIGYIEVIQEFRQYLEDLSDPNSHFNEIKEKYSKWQENTGFSSFEITYDFFHKNSGIDVSV